MKTPVLSLLSGPALLALCGLLLGASSLRAQSLGTTGLDFSTGKYGSSQSTKIYYVPFTGAFDVAADWTVKLTVPYIRVTGPGNVVRDLGSVGGPTTRTTTESGLGDILTSAAWTFYQEQQTGLSYGVTGKIKFGTASRSKGLGSGENDAMFQFDASRAYGAWLPFGTVGYRILGDPAGVNLRNGFYGSAGTTYRVDTYTNVGAAFDLRQKSTAGADNAAELSAFVTHRLDSQWRLQGYLVAGLTDASPDFGVGGMVLYKF